MSEPRDLLADVWDRCVGASSIACRPFLIAGARALAMDVCENRVTAAAARKALCSLCLEFNVEPRAVLAAHKQARDQFDSEFIAARCAKPSPTRW